MLIRFRIKNYLSYKEEACLSLVPSRVRSHGNHVFKESNDRGQIPALRAAFIYGANASGKSNIVKALDSMQKFVRGEKRSGIQKSAYFRPCKDCHSLPTELIVEFKINGYNYEFGFHVLAGEVVKEWLLRVKKESVKTIYKREVVNGKSKFENGKLNLSTEKEQFFIFTQKGTSSRKLFITEFVDRNVANEIETLTAISDAVEWFDDKLMVIFPNTVLGGLEFQMDKNVEIAKPITKMLKLFDTGIASLKLTKVDHEKGLPDVPEKVFEDISENLEPNGTVLLSGPVDTRLLFSADENKNLTTSKLTTVHLSEDGQEVQFDISDESDGTRRLLDIAPGMLSLLATDKVLVVDEIDRSLHPDITYSFISSFLRSDSDPKSQLIVTTHDRGLLVQDLVRKDEVWFAQKNHFGESSLYSLDEFEDIRNDTDFGKGYKQGRYGGVPIIASFTKEDILGPN